MALIVVILSASAVLMLIMINDVSEDVLCLL